MGPFVSGIYAGDPEKLSLRSAFPQLYEAEKSAGSIIRGLLFSAKKRPASAEKPTLQTFREGNQTLIQALSANLGANLRCGVTAQRIRLVTAPRGDTIDTATVEVTVLANGREEVLTTNRLIIATPAQEAATLLRRVDPQFESALSPIAYAPVAVVSLGYAKPQSITRSRVLVSSCRVRPDYESWVQFGTPRFFPIALLTDTFCSPVCGRRH